MVLPKVGKAISSMGRKIPMPGGRGTTAAMVGIGAVGLLGRTSRNCS